MTVAGRKSHYTPVFSFFFTRHLAVKQPKLIRVVQCFLWVSLCEIAQRPLFKQRAVEKKRVKYVKEKHRPVPQQLLSTKAPD